MKLFTLTWLAVAASCFASSALAQWEKSVAHDRMTGKPSMVVYSVRSAESLALPAPYDGENRATLRMRVGPSIPFGIDIALAVDKGQIMCTNPKNCLVRVKMGDGEPFIMRGSRPADQSANMLILSDDGAKFTKASGVAEKILVEATFYQAGTHLMEFNAPGGMNAAFKPAAAASQP
jgi:hypothetical protein